MKTIFRLLCGWMAIALAACTGDELQQIEPLQKPVAQKTISVKAYTPSEQAATRLDFKDKGEDGLKLSWTDGDAFTAVIDGEEVTFTYNESSKEFTANVNESVTLTDGIVAYYPAYDGEIFVRDFSIQTGTLNSATTYMEGVYEGDAFSFNHSTAILKASFGLPQNAVISSIQISGAVDITIANYNSSAAAYINLPDIAKDGKLTFDVRTSDGTLYTATKTVAALEGIETGVYYNTNVALSPAPVCNLPGYSTTEGKNLFNDAVIPFLQSNPSLTKIKFIANSDNTGENNQIGTSGAYMVAGSDKTLEIHTAAAEFVFNADCSFMFSGLPKITAIDFNNCINTSKVTNMASMFRGCSSLESLDLSSFNTANVIFMNGMFNHCSALTSLDLSSFKTANVEDMVHMFNFCSSLTSLDLSNFNTEKVTSMASMFYFCLNISELDLSSFVFKENVILTGMFTNLGESVSPLVYIYVKDVNDKDKLDNPNTGIPYYVEYVIPGHLPTGDEFYTAVGNFLDENSSLTKIKFVANSSNTNKDNQISNSGAYMVAGSDNTLEIHTSGAEFVFNADCFGMFDGLSTITAISFNDCVNTSNVTNMASMFDGCSSLQSITFGNSFNTSKVTDISYMFSRCSALTSLDLRNFNTSKVTDMASMFFQCSALTSLNVSSFNTSKVTTMDGMFYDCFSISELKLINFDFRNVTDFDGMFYCLARDDNAPVPVYVYVTQDSYNILENKNTGINSNYAWFVDEEGTKYGN